MFVPALLPGEGTRTFSEQQNAKMREYCAETRKVFRTFEEGAPVMKREFPLFSLHLLTHEDLLRI